MDLKNLKTKIEEYRSKRNLENLSELKIQKRIRLLTYAGVAVLILTVVGAGLLAVVGMDLVLKAADMAKEVVQNPRNDFLISAGVAPKEYLEILSNANVGLFMAGMAAFFYLIGVFYGLEITIKIGSFKRELERRKYEGRLKQLAEAYDSLRIKVEGGE